MLSASGRVGTMKLVIGLLCAVMASSALYAHEGVARPTGCLVTAMKEAAAKAGHNLFFHHTVGPKRVRLPAPTDDGAGDLARLARAGSVHLIPVRFSDSDEQPAGRSWLVSSHRQRPVEVPALEGWETREVNVQVHDVPAGSVIQMVLRQLGGTINVTLAPDLSGLTTAFVTDLPARAVLSIFAHCMDARFSPFPSVKGAYMVARHRPEDVVFEPSLEGARPGNLTLMSQRIHAADVLMMISLNGGFTLEFDDRELPSAMAVELNDITPLSGLKLVAAAARLDVLNSPRGPGHYIVRPSSR